MGRKLSSLAPCFDLSARSHRRWRDLLPVDKAATPIQYLVALADAWLRWRRCCGWLVLLAWPSGMDKLDPTDQSRRGQFAISAARFAILGTFELRRFHDAVVPTVRFL